MCLREGWETKLSENERERERERTLSSPRVVGVHRLSRLELYVVGVWSRESSVRLFSVTCLMRSLD